MCRWWRFALLLFVYPTWINWTWCISRNCPKSWAAAYKLAQRLGQSLASNNTTVIILSICPFILLFGFQTISPKMTHCKFLKIWDVSLAVACSYMTCTDEAILSCTIWVQLPLLVSNRLPYAVPISDRLACAVWTIMGSSTADTWPWVLSSLGVGLPS